MDSNALSNSTPPGLDSNRSTGRNDVVRKTSFTIPSMSGFWKPPASEIPAEPEPSNLTSDQEENPPPPPMPISWPEWRWPAEERANISFASQPTVANVPLQPISVERSGASEVHSSVRLAARRTRRKLLFAAVLIVMLLALLVSGTFTYLNSRAVTRDAAPPSVKKAEFHYFC